MTAEEDSKDYEYIIAGDIGGTNCRIALYAPSAVTLISSEPFTPIVDQRYSNQKYVKEHGGSAFYAILHDFFNKCKAEDSNFKSHDNIKVSIHACFACAGPINENECIFSNLKFSNNNFIINGDDIKNSKDGYLNYIKVCKIINDFVGQGYGCLDLDLDNECEELVPGSIEKIKKSSGPKVCIGAGTGLGECFLTCSSINPSVGYECFPSEGGHVEYAPSNELEEKLWVHLKKRFDETPDRTSNRISVERVASGKGLADVYFFLAGNPFLAGYSPDEVDAEVKKFKAADDKGKVVGENAERGNLCGIAVGIFARAYGAEAGNCCLKWLCTGGLYVSGDIIGKMLKNLKTRGYFYGDESEFMTAFKKKGRLSSIFKDIPVVVVTPDPIKLPLGVRGAFLYAKRELKKNIAMQSE